jgi:hypothetical protein
MHKLAARCTKTHSHVVAGRSRGPFRLLLGVQVYKLRLLIFDLTRRGQERRVPAVILIFLSQLFSHGY